MFFIQMCRQVVCILYRLFSKHCTFVFDTIPTAPPNDEQSSRRSRRHRRRHGAERRHQDAEQRHATEIVEIPTDIADFNPTHPFAFRPPEYDELSTTNSEPPKYDEIAMIMSSPPVDTGNNDGGNTNTAFEPDDHQRDVPPPIFGIARASTTESGGVVRVQVQSVAQEVDDDPPPPEYEVAVQVASSDVSSGAIV